MDAMKADLAELDNLQQGASQSQTVAVKPGPSSTALNSLVNEFDLSPFGGSPRTPPPERKMYSSKSEPALPTKTDAKGRRFRPGAGVVLNSLGSSDRDKDKGSRSNKRSSPPSQDRDSPQEKQGDRDREREELATADTADTTDTTNTAEDTAQMGAIAAAAQAAASLTVRAVVIGMNGIGGSRGQKAQKRGAETPSNAEIGEGTAGEIHLVLSTEAGTPTALGGAMYNPMVPLYPNPAFPGSGYPPHLGYGVPPGYPPVPYPAPHMHAHHSGPGHRGTGYGERGGGPYGERDYEDEEEGLDSNRSRRSGGEGSRRRRPPPRKKAASSLRSEGKATSKDSAGKIVSFQETYEQHQNEVKTRAVKLIQRWFRSPKQQHRRFMQFVKQRDMANVILTELIDEFLATDFIPDLLIHILTTKGDEYVWRNEELAALHSTAADLINEVVAAQAKSVVEGVISDMVDSYLGALRANPGREASRNLITEIRDSIIDECIEDSAPELVKEAINEMADAYLVDNEAHSILWSLLGPHIETVCNEARVGVLMDRALDQMIEIELKESVPEIVVEAIKEVNESMMQDRLAKDNELLMAASEHVVDALLMQYACWYVSDRGEVASIVTSLNNYMDAIIADSLMRNFAASLQNHQAVASSKVHNRIHQDISAPPIFDALMDMVLEEVEDAEDEEHDLELHYSEIDLIF
eukprot:CAMPEP_0175092572 /NCGR_PEP_ID=MMETSP0086_2-20121207/2535_1 /TAXON_ID=136419 /ORGANISM="Unknown Unknown, Strain D1" /LENGTH=693 /DNA_ID=CAMNT_0016365445 /DNA_START=110 /DNA_END=2191 /DNA_ORIENTATION=+